MNKGVANKVVQLFWGCFFLTMFWGQFLSYSFRFHFLFIPYCFLFISIYFLFIAYSFPFHFIYCSFMHAYLFSIPAMLPLPFHVQSFLFMPLTWEIFSKFQFQNSKEQGSFLLSISYLETIDFKHQINWDRGYPQITKKVINKGVLNKVLGQDGLFNAYSFLFNS